MSENQSKYKMFRNYMCNELGITKADIEIWAKQAVIEETKKQMGQINIKEIIVKTIKGRWDNLTKKAIIAEIGKALAKRVILQEPTHD